MTTHRRHFRSSPFAESGPEDIAVRRKGKRTEYGPRGDTFDHLFGASLSVTGRRMILGFNSSSSSVQGALRTSTFPKVMHRNCYDGDNNNVATSVLHRPLELNGRRRNDEDRSKDDDDNDAADCRAAAAAATTDRFPFLQRGMRASDGSLTTCLGLSIAAETPLEDLPRDIYWLGDPLSPPPPPLDFAENPTQSHDQPTFEEAPSSYPAETGQQVSSSSSDLTSAICWLGDPVVNAPQPPKTEDRSCRSRLRSNPFNNNLMMMETTRYAAAPRSLCRIRRQQPLQRNIGSTCL